MHHNELTKQQTPQPFKLGRTRWVIGIIAIFALGPVSLFGVMLLDSLLDYPLEALRLELAAQSRLRSHLWPLWPMVLHALLYFPVIFFTYYRNKFSLIVTILIIVGYLFGLYEAATFNFV